MWPFKKKAKPLPGAKKLSLINVRDYPKEAYSAYWEIGVSGHAPFHWVARFIDYATGAELDVAKGGPHATEDEARRESQTWVLERIENYRRRAG